MRAFGGVPNGAVPARAATLEAFVALGGRVVPGAGAGRVALLARSRRLARASAGVVAFLWGRRGDRCSRCGRRPGRGSRVVLAGGGTTLPSFPDGQVATDVYGIACRSLSR